MTDVTSGPAMTDPNDPPDERISGWIRWLVILVGTFGILLTMNQVFNWNFFGVMEVFGVDLESGRRSDVLLVRIDIATPFGDRGEHPIDSIGDPRPLIRERGDLIGQRRAQLTFRAPLFDPLGADLGVLGGEERNPRFGLDFEFGKAQRAQLQRPRRIGGSLWIPAQATRSALPHREESDDD